MPPLSMIKGDFNTTFIVYKTDQVYKKIKNIKKTTNKVKIMDMY